MSTSDSPRRDSAPPGPPPSGAPNTPGQPPRKCWLPIPEGQAKRLKLALLLLWLTAVILGLWLSSHLGWIVGAVALASAVAMSLAGWLLDKVKDGFKEEFNQFVGKPSSICALEGALVVVVLFTFSCSSVVVTVDTDAGSSVSLWPAGDSASKEYLSARHPIRRFGLVWTRVPVFTSAAYQLRGPRRYGFFLADTLGYPSDFGRRQTLFLLPAGAFYRNVRQQRYRLYLIDAHGDTLTRTTVGGPEGPWSVWVGGEPPSEAFDTMIADYARLNVDTIPDEMLSAWKRKQPIQAPRNLPPDSVVVAVAFDTTPPVNLFRQTVHLKDPVALISQ